MKRISRHTLFNITIALFLFDAGCTKENKEKVPILTTSEITIITGTTAISGGTITSEGTGTVIARGVCWSINITPIIADNKTFDGAGVGSYSSSITGLSGVTTYYVRAYATNESGTGYGMTLSFTTKPPVHGLPIKDFEGNVYKTVIIGTQTWMAENLKATKFNDGTIIPNIASNSEWGSLTTPGYCWYDNDIANKNTYGALYNWFTAATNKLCPTGWHVPTDSEWTTLVIYLGVDPTASIKLKETGYDHWQYSPAIPMADNESGFTALPGGLRYRVFPNTWLFWEIRGSGNWWSSTESSSNASYCRRIYMSYVLKDSFLKSCGFSIRCIRD